MTDPYFQSSDFTCGPASLMMAMRRLDPTHEFDPLEEFLIWREANSIFMGHRHAGCTQYGLALAATKRNFKAEIYSSGIKNFDKHFEDCVLQNKEKSIFKLVHAHDKEAVKKQGIKIFNRPFSKQLFVDLLKEKKQIILLIRSFKDNEEHWVVITKAGEDRISILDPFKENLSDRSAEAETKGLTHRIDYDRFERRCLFGKNKDFLLIALSQ